MSSHRVFCPFCMVACNCIRSQVACGTWASHDDTISVAPKSSVTTGVVQVLYSQFLVSFLNGSWWDMVPTGCEITIPRPPGMTRTPSPAPFRKAASLRQAWKFTLAGPEIPNPDTPLRTEVGVPRTPAAIAPEPGAVNSPSMAQQTTSVVEMIRRIL